MFEDCIFCRIVRGEIPSKKIYEDEQCLAFRDIAPKAPLHCVVIPREHFSGATEITLERESLVGHLMRVASDIAKDHHMETRGFRLVVNSGAEGGQTVFHLHLHLLAGRPLGQMG